MFGQKHGPKAPWSVQLLTTEFLVAGHLDGDNSTGLWFLQVQPRELAMATLTLTDASFDPTGSQQVPETRAARWVLPSTALWVGLLPRDDGSLAYCASHNGGSKHPFPGAVVYVGPYAVRGTIMSPDTYIDLLSGYLTFVMTEVVIDHLAPGARLKGLAAPYIILRTLLVHGIVLNA